MSCPVRHLLDASYQEGVVGGLATWRPVHACPGALYSDRDTTLGQSINCPRATASISINTKPPLTAPLTRSGIHLVNDQTHGCHIALLYITTRDADRHLYRARPLPTIVSIHPKSSIITDNAHGSELESAVERCSKCCAMKHNACSTQTY